MAQKRRSGGRIRRPKEVDFRCPSDDAWYSVRLYKEKDGVIRVMYREFTEEIDERYLSDEIQTRGQLDDLVGRFRLPALQLQDSECGKVKEGMMVLVCHTFPEDELRFYDAVVDSVSVAQHKKGGEGEQEICTCKFKVRWREGPLRGERVTVSAGDICLIQNLPVDDPILLGFFEKVKNSLEMQGKYNERIPSRRFSGLQLQEPSRSSQNETKSKRAATPQSRSGGEISRGLESEGTAQNCSTETYYFFWVDNVEKGTTACSIMRFLERELSVSSQVILYPFLYNSNCSASIFVKDENDANKLLSFLFDHKAIIVSSEGSPWIANERCCGKIHYQMPRLEMNNSEEKLEKGPGLRIVKPGSEGFELAERLLDLHKKFHEHMQGLQETLGSEETKLRNSVIVINAD